jgi:hypothetical protein
MAGQRASFSILLDRGRIVSKAWQVSVLPTTFMLDGNLAARFVTEGDVDWAQPAIEKIVTRLSHQKPAGKADRAF